MFSSKQQNLSASFRRQAIMADSAGAKRRLFRQDTAPLKNRVFYLDLKHYTNTRSLKRKIEEFGGRVDEFLSKEVSCVITNSDITGTEPLRKSPRNKASNVPSNKPLTRAQGILAKAKQKQPGRQKANVVAVAKGLGIDVKHVDDVIKWLKTRENGKDSGKNEAGRVLRSRANRNETEAKVRNLKSPFVKIEDQSRLYNPLFKELDEWPAIHFESYPPDCPFDQPRKNQVRSKSGYSTSSSTKGQQFNGQTAKATGHNGSSQKAGYCEVCKANYRGLKQHLRGVKHKKNATDSTAYKELDETVREGKTIAEYLKQLRSEYAGEGKSTTAREIEACTPKRRNEVMQSPSKHITPLKIIFSPRTGYTVKKAELASKIKNQAEAKEEQDNVIVTKLPRKRHVDEYSVVWMSELTMKIKRSTRILRGAGCDQGSAYVDFPVFKEQLSSSNQPTSSTKDNSEDSAVITKYGDVQGKLRLSTRVLDAENHQGFEEFKCPMYVESSEQ